MCKRNCPDKNEASTGCVRETPQIKLTIIVRCERESPRYKGSQHGLCKRNSPHKNKVSTGCVRETPLMKMKEPRLFKRDFADKNENSTGWKREIPPIRKGIWHGMCKRNSPHKNSMECIRETPRIKM